MKRILAASIALAASLGSHYAISDEGRIVGGVDASIDERPYQVALLTQYGGQWCGGALIADKWVLTAAHCVRPSSITITDVFLGSATLSSGGEVIAVKRIFSHPDYNNATHENDVALIELAQPAPSHLTRLELPTPDILDIGGQDGDIATASGWGDLFEFGTAPDQLQKVDLPIVSHSVCQAAFQQAGSPSQITPDMICAGPQEGGMDACQGDSGGPLTINVGGVDYSLGVVSWGRGCARSGLYGVYARTSAFTDWINATMSRERVRFLNRRLHLCLTLTGEEGPHSYGNSTLTDCNDLAHNQQTYLRPAGNGAHEIVGIWNFNGSDVCLVGNDGYGLHARKSCSPGAYGAQSQWNITVNQQGYATFTSVQDPSKCLSIRADGYRYPDWEACDSSSTAQQWQIIPR